MKIRIFFFFALLMHTALFSGAQELSSGYIVEIGDSTDRLLQQRGLLYHSAFRPVNALLRTAFDTVSSKKTADNRIHISPVFDGAGGISDDMTFRGRMNAGAVARYQHNDLWSAELGYSVFATIPPAYLDSMARLQEVISGVGRAYEAGGGMYYAHYPYGRVNYRLGKHFLLEAGRGKHFWGDGFRSLIISDHASPYPYFSVMMDVWRLRLKALYAQLDQGGEKKNFAAHGLSLNVSRRLQFSFYEMVIWQTRDSLNNRNFDLHYLNPFIFYRPVEFAQGSADNVLLGGGFKWKATKHLQVYGQFILDEFLLAELRKKSGWWANKFGGQLGYKIIAWRGFSAQGEMNFARPFTYSHGSPLQAWGHRYQPLAHPLGANFGECYQNLRYELKNGLSFNWRGMYAVYGLDKDMNGDGITDNLGGNIFRSYKAPYQDFGNALFQGNRNELFQSEFTVAYRLKFLPGTEVYVMHSWRENKSDFPPVREQWLLAGIRWTGVTRPNWFF